MRTKSTLGLFSINVKKVFDCWSTWKIVLHTFCCAREHIIHNSKSFHCDKRAYDCHIKWEWHTQLNHIHFNEFIWDSFLKRIDSIMQTNLNKRENWCVLSAWFSTFYIESEMLQLFVGRTTVSTFVHDFTEIEISKKILALAKINDVAFV